jgi:hypothetical protein
LPPPLKRVSIRILPLAIFWLQPIDGPPKAAWQVQTAFAARQTPPGAENGACNGKTFAYDPGSQGGALLQFCRAMSGRSSGVEHNLAKVGVEGSNPFARSKFRCKKAADFRGFCFVGVWSCRDFACLPRPNLGGVSRRQSAGVTARWLRDVEHGKPTAEIGLVLRVLSHLGIELDLSDLPDGPRRKRQTSSNDDDFPDIDDIVGEPKR